MEQFKVNQERFKEIRKTILIRALPFLIISGTGGLAISYFNNRTSVFFPVMVPFVIILLIIGLYIGLKRKQKLWESYVLTIDDNGITREQFDTPTVIISNAEIKEIIKDGKGNFIVKGNLLTDIVEIPLQMGGYERIEQLLSERKEISLKGSAPAFQKFSGLFSGVLTIGLLMVVYLSKDKVLVGVCGTVLLILLAYSFFEIRRSKNIDARTKRGGLLIFLVFVSIIGIMYLKLTGKFI